MRKLAAALAAAFLCLPVAAGDLEARQGDDSVRLTDKPCTAPAVLERLEPGAREQYQAASAVFQGQRFTACWRMMGNVAHLVYEDGDQGIIPALELKPVSEI